MHTALAAALENGELFALYQPQLSVDGARVVSAEALLRWRRPGVGMVLPEDFVPYAEANRLIEPLGAFMLELACQTAAEWDGLPVSINVSPLQFAQTDLVDLILTSAQRARLVPGQLEIEITETAPIADIDAACETIDRLRDNGVRVALDDLGCGHASTFLMQALPLDRVKLGKPIVDQIATGEGAAGVAHLVRQALDLGLEVTAEGVETPEQLAFLRNCGCDRIQGFLFARPMTGHELRDFARLIEA